MPVRSACDMGRGATRLSHGAMAQTRPWRLSNPNRLGRWRWWWHQTTWLSVGPLRVQLYTAKQSFTPLRTSKRAPTDTTRHDRTHDWHTTPPAKPQVRPQPRRRGHPLEHHRGRHQGHAPVRGWVRRTRPAVGLPRALCRVPRAMLCHVIWACDSAPHYNPRTAQDAAGRTQAGCRARTMCQSRSLSCSTSSWMGALFLQYPLWLVSHDA